MTATTAWPTLSGGPRRFIANRLYDRNSPNDGTSTASASHACALARNFIEERFGVIIDDLVADAEALSMYVEGLMPCGVPVHFVRLMPTLAECERRDRERAEWRAPPGRVAQVYREMEAAGTFAGATIDSTTQTVQETADRVQVVTTAGESVVWAPGGESARG
jgi:chloramphenicol 3-O-phosphotransferase